MDCRVDKSPDIFVQPAAEERHVRLENRGGERGSKLVRSGRAAGGAASGAASGVASGAVSGVASGAVSGVASGAASGAASVAASGAVSGVASGAASGAASAVASGAASGGMSEQFPLFRFGTLLARQLSAPVARQVKAAARRHPWFRRAVCVALGRAARDADLRLRMWTLRLRRPRALAPLSERAALELGADVLGEIIVFSLGAAIVVFEVNRQAANERAQKLSAGSQRLAVRLQLEELVSEQARQRAQLARLRAALAGAAEERAGQEEE